MTGSAIPFHSSPQQTFEPACMYRTAPHHSSCCSKKKRVCVDAQCGAKEKVFWLYHFHYSLMHARYYSSSYRYRRLHSFHKQESVFKNSGREGSSSPASYPCAITGCNRGATETKRASSVSFGTLWPSERKPHPLDVLSVSFRFVGSSIVCAPSDAVGFERCTVPYRVEVRSRYYSITFIIVCQR